MILFFFLFAAWMWLLGPWFVALPLLVFGPVYTLAEVYGVVMRRGDYVQLLPDGILLVGVGFPLLSNHIPYEAIAMAELKDRWSDRIARSLLKVVGRQNAPTLEIRFRWRVRLWWILPVKRLYFRPTDPDTVVTALSARLGTA